MNSVKVKRLNNAFQEEISMILLREVKDPNLKFITITSCDITPDLSFARIYYTVLNDDKKKEIAESLRKVTPFVRGELSKRVKVRHTPEIRFYYDESIEYGKKIEAKIEELKERNELY